MHLLSRGYTALIIMVANTGSPLAAQKSQKLLIYISSICGLSMKIKWFLWILLCQGRGAESTETTEFW